MAAEGLSGFIAEQRKKGVKLAGKQKKELSKAIQQSGKKGRGSKITAAELARGRKFATKTNTPDYLATVARTFAPKKLTAPVRKKLQKRGFTKDETGYYTKSGQITQNVLDKARAAGYSDTDLRSIIARDFAAKELDDQVGKFLGEAGGYKLNPTTGKWEASTLGIGPNNIPGIGDLDVNEGPYAGINPDAASGATPAEFDYATLIDPYKIEAKSRERLGLLQAGLGAYLGRLQAGSAERISRGTTQAEKDIARLQQATDLMGKQMAYGTEYDLAKVNRLAGLQQLQSQQATSLYNLIPSAF